MEDLREPKELVLPPGAYAYMQDVTKGTIRIFAGPTVINQTAQEVPVIYDSATGAFSRAKNLESAVRQSPVAVEGYYCVLFNPVNPDNPVEGQPRQGMAGSPSPDLQIGRRVVIPGPCMFPLWPGQAAHVIRGHQLSRNEYLKVRVYNEVEARKHWGQAIVQPQSDPPTTKTENSQLMATPDNLTVGREIVVKGEDVSFFIPHTGITVISEEFGKYVRAALTLERLEYCMLVDEDGNKRYERGPQVVFPAPTEKFIPDEAGRRKFRAHELNKIQGIHIKVIEDYVDEEDRARGTGDELFLTGEVCQIYYPRKEHSIVTYDGKAKHFATAIPAGEGRYVLDRISGEIETVLGPEMLLPNPVHEVIVRRALTISQCELWYPQNQTVLAFNLALQEAMKQAPTTRAGAVSDGDLERHATRSRKVQGDAVSSVLSSTLSMAHATLGESAGQGFQADEFSRKSTYTQPRTLTLDKTNYGVPLIQPFTGYAVLITTATGERRVVEGPSSVLLKYDETLEVLELSTGKPKSTDKLYRTVYLRTKNNKVADSMYVDTSDHVRVNFKLSYVVNFEGESIQWFAVENYVKFLCDHMRSLLKGKARLLKIKELYEDPSKFIRDVVLGPKVEGKRAGRVFSENNMRVADVEVLGVEILDDRIRGLLQQTQHHVVSSNLEAETARHELEILTEVQSIEQAKLKVLEGTKVLKASLVQEEHKRALDLTLFNLEAKLETAAETLKTTTADAEIVNTTHAASLQRNAAAETQNLDFLQRHQALELNKIQVEAQTVIDKFNAMVGPFGETLAALGNQDALVKIAKAGSLQANFMGDYNVIEALQKLFGEGQLGAEFKKAVVRATLPSNGSNGSKTAD